MERLFIICEGASEENYIVNLQRLLQEDAICDFRLIKYAFGGSRSYNDFKTRIKTEIKKIKQEKIFKKDSIYIWFDMDIFINRYPNKMPDFKCFIDNIKIPVKIKILCNYFNFEDFFILHYDDEKILSLQKKLKNKKHFNSPLISEKYHNIYKKVLKDYEKGSFPSTLKLDLITINKCLKNIDNQKYLFHSDIKELLVKIIEKIEKES